MKYFKLVITLAVSCCLSISAFSQSDFTKERTLQVLSDYIKHKELMPPEGHISKVRWLKSDGVDVSSFATSMLNYKEFSDYRTEALYLLAADKYVIDPVGLIKIVTDDFNKNLYNNSVSYLQSNNQCLNILSMLVGPNFFKNESVKEELLQFSEVLFKNTSVLQIEYWQTHIDADLFASNNRENLTQDQQTQLTYPETILLSFIGFAGKLYLATDDEKYLNIINRINQSNDESFSNTVKFWLLDKTKEDWQSGRYELFAVDRGLLVNTHQRMSEVELQRLRETSLSARQKAQN